MASYSSSAGAKKNLSYEYERLQQVVIAKRDALALYKKRAEEARISDAMDEQKFGNAVIMERADMPLPPAGRSTQSRFFVPSVRRRKYRFRFLNTGPTQTYDITLIKPDGSVGTMVVIATDANFLQNPIPIDAGANAGNSNSTTAPIVPGGLRVSVAERYDVVIDFGAFPAGSKLYLKENRSMFVGNPSPDPLPPGLAIENVLMQFNVVNTEAWFPRDTPAIPATLCTYPTLPPADTTFEWQFVRDPVGSVPRLFKINDRVFDPEVPQHCILQDTTEEWLLNNNVGGSAWVHPVHIHFEEFRTLKRFVNGVEVPVPPLQSGRKDVSRLEAGQGALIRMQFRDISGRYLIHCHNMAHEDAFMMVRWDIVPDAAAKAACDALIVEGRKEFESKLRNEEVA